MSGRYKKFFVIVGLIVAGSVIAVAVFASTLSSNSSLTGTGTTATNITTTTLATTQSIINPLPTSVSSTPIPGIGLSLHLNLSASVLLPNETSKITGSDFNTLATYNTLNYSNNWSLPSILDWWPCMGGSIYYAIFQGYYVRSNITGVVPLPLFPPGYGALCPASNFTNFRFHPQSDIASIEGGRGIPQEWSDSIFGYYSTTPQVLTNGSSYTILHFKQGAYTVVEGDEWGDLVISYFRVI